MSAILERIKKAYQLDTDAEVADFLGLKPSTLSMQKNRGRLDIQRIIQKCSDLNKNWLLDGEGEMTKEEMYTTEDLIPVYSSLSIENGEPDFYKSQKSGNIFADITEELQASAADQIIGYVIPENSLAPVLKKNDIAIINLDYSLSDNAICLISANQKVKFRRFAPKKERSDIQGNGYQDLPQVQSNKNEYDINIIGELVWIMRRL